MRLRTLIVYICIICILQPLKVIGSNLVMVYTDHADLFQHNIVVDFLNRNQIVRIHPAGNQSDWVMVQIGDSIFESEKSNFLTKPEITAEFTRNQQELNTSLSGFNERIESNIDTEIKLFRRIVELEKDRLTYYKVRIVHNCVENNLHAANCTRKTLALDDYRHNFRHDIKIGRSQAKRMIKVLYEDIDSLQQHQLSLFQKRYSAIDQLQQKEDIYRHRMGLFRRFSQNPDTYLHELYVITDESAGLFRGTVKIDELSHDALVLARPNKADTKWLKVWLKNEWFDSSADAFKRLSKLRRIQNAKISVLTQRLQDSDNRISILNRKRNIVQEEIDGILRLTRQIGNYLELYSAETRYRSSLNSHGGYIVSDVIERRDVKKLERKWQKSIDSLDRQIDEKVTARQKLVDELERSKSEYRNLQNRQEIVRIR